MKNSLLSGKTKDECHLIFGTRNGMLGRATANAEPSNEAQVVMWE